MALTYSLNPTFFEMLVLPDLWYGGTGEIVFVADERQLEDGLHDVTAPTAMAPLQGRQVSAPSGGPFLFLATTYFRLGLWRSFTEHSFCDR